MNLFFKYFLLSITFLFSVNCISQKAKEKIIISGYVKDSLNQPVNNAAIFVDGIKTKTKTDNKGFFSVVSKYKPKKIMILSDLYGIEEIDYYGQVLDITYGSQSLNVTGRDEFSSHPIRLKDNIVYQNIYDYLNGRVPGVYVHGDNKITIRGSTSFNSSIEPLFIVNGTTTADISTIIPREIKSVTVLKGPETASYGVRGANGVILIETY